MGDETICFVWSFLDKMSDIPYRIDLKAGAKPRKVCTCPAFSYSGGSTCKHLITMRQEAKDGTLLTDDRYQLTDFGKKLLKLNE